MKAALLIVDMQQAFFKVDPLRSLASSMVGACNELIDHAKIHDAPVIVARTIHKKDRSTWTLKMLEDDKGFLFEGDSDAQHLDGLDTDQAHEIIKTRDSAFWQTELYDYLKQNSIERLIIAGVSTHQCVAQTAVDAYNANLRVELAIDTIATDRPDMHQPFLDFLSEQYDMKDHSISDIAW